jgi:hypothetical protein
MIEKQENVHHFWTISWKSGILSPTAQFRNGHHPWILAVNILLFNQRSNVIAWYSRNNKLAERIRCNWASEFSYCGRMAACRFGKSDLSFLSNHHGIVAMIRALFSKWPKMIFFYLLLFFSQNRLLQLI